MFFFFLTQYLLIWPWDWKCKGSFQLCKCNCLLKMSHFCLGHSSKSAEPYWQKLAVQTPSIRMGLRSYRNSTLIPMETSSSSSSSDDSCDSFGSDGGFANTVTDRCQDCCLIVGECVGTICDWGLCLFRRTAPDTRGGRRRSQRRLRRRAWSTGRWNPWLETQWTHIGHLLDVWTSQNHGNLIIIIILFQKVNKGSVGRGRRTTGLKVAMTFPTKKTSKRPASEPLPQNKAQDSDSEEEENFIVKRALNIKENKEMVLLEVFFLLFYCCWSWTLIPADVSALVLTVICVIFF